VFPLVSRELVRAGKARITVAKVAQVGLLARVDPFVRLQVRALRVHLVAARIFAVVHAALLQIWIIVSLPLHGLSVLVAAGHLNARLAQTNARPASLLLQQSLLLALSRARRRADLAAHGLHSASLS